MTFPADPRQALLNSIQKCDQKFLELAHQESQNGDLVKAGSCAIIVLIVAEIVYIANVGDSRALLCMNQGRNFAVLSQDHKPENERSRIEQAGGRVYQNYSYIPDPSPDSQTGQQ